MRKVAFLLCCFFTIAAFSQTVRQGKDSISPTIGLINWTDFFTTNDILNLQRVGPTKPAVSLNTDTGTFWYWDGTVWKNMFDVDPSELSITVDPAITNGSTNPVENNALWDRFIKTVDEDPVSQYNDVTVYRGDSTHFAANKSSLGTNYIAFVSDYEFDPSPTGIGQDAKISNVIASGQQLIFSGENGAFNGSVTLPNSGSGNDDQILSQFNFNNTNYDLTIGIENGNNLTTPLDKLWQDASDIEVNDNNIPFTANDVQELFEELFASGSGSQPVLIAEEWSSSVSQVGQMFYEWKRVGTIVHFNAKLDIDISVLSPGFDYNIGGRFLATIPNTGGSLPLPTTSLSTPTNKLTAGRTIFSGLPDQNERADAWIVGDGGSQNTLVYLNYAVLIPQQFNINGTYTVSITGTYLTNSFN